MIDAPLRRHRYRPPEGTPQSEQEARAARVVCVQVGRLLSGTPGRIDALELARLVDVYEAWREVTGVDKDRPPSVDAGGR